MIEMIFRTLWFLFGDGWNPKRKFLCKQRIWPTGRPYLDRLIIYRTRWFGSLYIHKFYGPDPAERPPHNHPWKWAASYVLKGWYVEEVCQWGPEGDMVCFKRKIRPWMIRFLRGREYHSIRIIQVPTYTIFFTGHRNDRWGFLVPGEGHVDFQEYLTRTGEPFKQE